MTFLMSKVDEPIQTEETLSVGTTSSHLWDATFDRQHEQAAAFCALMETDRHSPEALPCRETGRNGFSRSRLERHSAGVPCYSPPQRRTACEGRSESVHEHHRSERLSPTRQYCPRSQRQKSRRPQSIQHDMYHSIPLNLRQVSKRQVSLPCAKERKEGRQETVRFIAHSFFYFLFFHNQEMPRKKVHRRMVNIELQTK